MSAVRGRSATGDEELAVTDLSGGVLYALRLPAHLGFVATLTTGDDVTVVLDLNDTLALLSFLADAAGVERFVPDNGTPLGDIADT